MPKQPHNEHELELALTRLAGSNLAAVVYRDMMAGVILGQMLPSGTVVKGGTSLRLRFGPEKSRVTMDFDTARSMELEEFIKFLRVRLAAAVKTNSQPQSLHTSVLSSYICHTS